MKNFTPSVLAALMLASAATGSAITQRQESFMKKHAEDLFRYAKKTSFKPLFTPVPDLKNGPKREVAAATNLDASDEFGYLDMPDGSTWYFTAEYEVEVIQHEAYQEKSLKGFKYNIYDTSFELRGSISDDLPVEGNRTRVAGISLSSVVTSKFFNSDDKYELIVGVAYNTPNYNTETASFVYSLGSDTDESGYNTPVAEMSGYVVDAVDTSTDEWSESYYMTFFSEINPNPDDFEDFTEFAAAYKQEVRTYKKAGWSGGPQQIHSYEVSNANLPGDRMNSPFYMLIPRDGKLWIVIQEYEKWFFDNVVGPDENVETGSEVGAPTQGNNLIVRTYEYSGYGDVAMKQETKIPCVVEDANPDVLYRFYSINGLDYSNDIIFNGDEATFNLTVEKYMRTDDDNYLKSFYKANAQGEITATIFEEADYIMQLSDIRGMERQYSFIKADDNGGYTFTMIDIESATERASIPSILGPVSLKANMDRVAVAGGYEYAFSTGDPEVDDEGNFIEHVAWVDMNGQLARVDNIKLGKDIAYAQANIKQNVLDPYLFNTDAKREYMWLVKRYTGESTTTQEEFVLVSETGDVMLTRTPEAEKGAIASVSMIPGTEGSKLAVIYRNNETYKYYQDFYDLPMVKFAQGGDGTEANPYKVATIGDLQAIRTGSTFCYEIVDDIDATGFEFSEINNFTGKLSGNGHSVSNLVLPTTGGVFGTIRGVSSASGEGENPVAGTSSVKDVTFIGVNANNVSSGNFGVLANELQTARVENVHVYGLEFAGAESEASIGGIAGRASLGSVINKCSVNSASVNAPECATVGGIVSTLRTGSSVSESSFMGTVTAGTEVGGIVGTMSADAKVTDCHVDADITARNTIGGIAGSSQRGEISRCYVEGSVKATTPFSQYLDLGPCAGGVVGELQPLFTEPQEGENVAPVIHHCFVALTSLEGYESQGNPAYGEQRTTIHRIAGRTKINEEPEVTGYDDNYEPIYGDPMGAENYISDNYAIADLERGSQSIEAAHNTTEGASVNPDDLSQSWFAETLGLKFGETEPWNELSDYDPALNHETANFLVQPEIYTRVGEKFNVSVVYVGRTPMTEEDALGSLILEADEQYMEMTGNYTFANSTLTVEFTALKEGEVTIQIAGAQGKVIIDEPSSITSVADDSEGVAITYDGNAVVAPGAMISIYNISGVEVANGRDSVVASSLSKGVYVAVATAADGSRSTLKISVR